MLSDIVHSWIGSVKIGDTVYENGASVDDSALVGAESIILQSSKKVSAERKESRLAAVSMSPSDTVYKIIVKPYMTRIGTPDFDFMSRWNSDKPMPLQTMIGIITKETKGMVYMQLRGHAEPTIRCLRCGKVLTNEVSKKYGIGPECLSKLGIERDPEQVKDIIIALQDVTWSGWIIKSAIVKQEVFEDEGSAS